MRLRPQTAPSSNIELRNARVLEHQAFACRLARKAAQRGRGLLDVEDVIQDAMVVLIELANQYDESRGVPFAAHVAALLPLRLHNRRRAVDPMGDRARRQIREYREAIDSLTGQFHRIPTDEEAARYLVWSRAKLRKVALWTSLDTLPLDAPLTQDGQDTFIANFPSTVDVEALVLNAETSSSLAVALHELPPRERDIICEHYVDGRSQHDIARARGLSPQRVQQLVAQSLARLRRTNQLSACC